MWLKLIIDIILYFTRFINSEIYKKKLLLIAISNNKIKLLEKLLIKIQVRISFFYIVHTSQNSSHTQDQDTSDIHIKISHKLKIRYLGHTIQNPLYIQDLDTSDIQVKISDTFKIRIHREHKSQYLTLLRSIYLGYTG